MIVLHPITIIEMMIAIGILMVFFIVALLTKKKRKLFLTITVFVLLAEVTFFIARPYWIDHQLSERKIELEEYLESKYPNENWEISTVNHRENLTSNPYYLKVVFESEPLYTYSYYVNGGGDVEQRSIYTPDSTPLEKLQHFEGSMDTD